MDAVSLRALDLLLYVVRTLLPPRGHWGCASINKNSEFAFYIWRFYLPNVCLVTHVTKYPNKRHNPLYYVVVNNVKSHKWGGLLSYHYCDSEGLLFIWCLVNIFPLPLMCACINGISLA